MIPSIYTKIKLVTAWAFRFINIRLRKEERNLRIRTTCLSTTKITATETHLFTVIQMDHFQEEIKSVSLKRTVGKASCLDPFLDPSRLLRVGGRQNLSYSTIHPIILHGKHLLTKLIIRTEHLHGGPTLVSVLI